MENKKQDPLIEKFANMVDSMGSEILDEDMGYLLLTYHELEKGNQENTYAVHGKLSQTAECIFSCMKHNPSLANVIIAASNAFAHYRMLEAQKDMLEQTTKEEPKKIVS